MSHAESNRIATPVMTVLTLAAVALVLGACGTDEDAPEDNGAGAPGIPTVVVTTNILGDVVSEMVGDLATVETVMPEGSDPHEFQPSAQQANAMREADVLVTNGAGFEEGLLATVEGAEQDGVAVCEAIEGVDAIDSDPHFFADPARMAAAVEGLADCMAGAVPALDTQQFAEQAAAYATELDDLDAEVESILAPVPRERRVLVTNHEVFGYFADRYGFEVAGAIIPSVSTQGEPDAAGLAELAGIVREEGVPAVFAETSSPEQLAEALSDEVGEVEVVTLFSESLGADGGETYVAMVRTNAQRIAGALA